MKKWESYSDVDVSCYVYIYLYVCIWYIKRPAAVIRFKKKYKNTIYTGARLLLGLTRDTSMGVSPRPREQGTVCREPAVSQHLSLQKECSILIWKVLRTHHVVANDAWKVIEGRAMASVLFRRVRASETFIKRCRKQKRYTCMYDVYSTKNIIFPRMMIYFFFYNHILLLIWE